jgi:catechol 2,3-dioxygenase
MGNRAAAGDPRCMTSTATPVLPATLTLGAVSLTVSNLDRSVAWYQTSLGLRVHTHDATTATLGDGEFTVLELVEDLLARPAGRHAGLYHYALLYPTREELARAAIRLSVTQTPIEGASDHRTHEAIYLPDPDGNGIELAADRPKADWPADLGYAGGPAALDFNALLATVQGEEPSAQVGPGLRMGHLHLHVGDIEQGLAFYRDVLGFEVQANLGSAAFVSAGGYHHHLGFNIWRGQGVGPAPEHTVGLRHWTVAVPNPDEVRARVTDAEEIEGGFITRDPWGTAVAFVAAGNEARGS